MFIVHKTRLTVKIWKFAVYATNVGRPDAANRPPHIFHNVMRSLVRVNTIEDSHIDDSISLEETIIEVHQ